MISAMILIACNHKTSIMDNQKHKYTNALINESSPYLLQHAHNPVDWHPWNKETLEKAKRENKMILVSIGYAACHWCHVMEHESFEDTTVAKIMNENFICIKVDREERPDVDDVYMSACHLSGGGSCGWPLNSFALPDGRPVWAGTYFPKNRWINVLNHFKKMFVEDYEKLENAAQQLAQGIQSMENIDLNTEDHSFSKKELNEVTDQFVSTIDWKEGGKVGAPKFPMPTNYEFLLVANKILNHKKALEAAILTADKMAHGGIFDQIGGGFARYSTDPIWLAPHFEKMLYDNGQLVSLYAHLFQITKKQLYKDVIDKTLAFVERELTNDEYGFYSSLDADSEGEEGKFYVWDASEIDSIIGDRRESMIYKAYYSVKTKGNWEHKNILMVAPDVDTPSFLKDFDITADELKAIINKNDKKLMAARKKRIRPGLDDKVLTSWNALMLKGYIDAYRALGEDHHLEIALKSARFLDRNALKKDGSLTRIYKDGKSSINAFLDDYAALIDAYIALYEITFDQEWLDKAELMTNYVLAHFLDDKSMMFYYTSDVDDPLVARKKELADNVIPGSNSMMARNLFKLGTMLYKEQWIDHSKQMLKNIWPQIKSSKQPNYYSNWCRLYATMIQPPYEVAILGQEAVAKSRNLQRHFLPHAFFLGGKEEGNMELLKDKLQDGRTMIYVCQNKVCKFPVEEEAKALKLIK